MTDHNGKLRVLIVDDSPTASIFLQHKLEMLAKGKLAIHIQVANSGEQAIKLLDNDSFDLAILDVILPGIDGYAVCKKIKKIAATRVAFLTAMANEADQQRGFDAGCEHYIKKPSTDHILEQLMERAATATKRGTLKK